MLAPAYQPSPASHRRSRRQLLPAAYAAISVARSPPPVCRPAPEGYCLPFQHSSDNEQNKQMEVMMVEGLRLLSGTSASRPNGNVVLPQLRARFSRIT